MEAVFKVQNMQLIEDNTTHKAVSEEDEVEVEVPSEVEDPSMVVY
jgi:hypothetical protein